MRRKSVTIIGSRELGPVEVTEDTEKLAFIGKVVELLNPVNLKGRKGQRYIRISEGEAADLVGMAEGLLP